MIPDVALNDKKLKSWLVEIWPDVTSVIFDDPAALKARNERFGAYIVHLSSWIFKYRVRGRFVKQQYEENTPRPDKGVTLWTEGRDSMTAEYRYWEEYLTNLRDDIQRRISLSQTEINFERQSLQTFGVANSG